MSKLPWFSLFHIFSAMFPPKWFTVGKFDAKIDGDLFMRHSVHFLTATKHCSAREMKNITKFQLVSLWQLQCIPNATSMHQLVTGSVLIFSKCHLATDSKVSSMMLCTSKQQNVLWNNPVQCVLTGAGRPLPTVWRHFYIQIGRVRVMSMLKFLKVLIPGASVRPTTGCAHSKIARMRAYHLYCIWLPCWLVCRLDRNEMYRDEIWLRKYRVIMVKKTLFGCFRQINNK